MTYLSARKNRIASFTEVEGRHQTKISFLNYHSLVHAIAIRYKVNLIHIEVSEDDLISPKLSKIINCPQKVVRCIYDTYISEVKTFPDKTFQKWKTKLNTNLSENDFLDYCNAMYSCTKSAKLIDFQYRILNSILVTNDKLFRWGIITGESCSLSQHSRINNASIKRMWN